VLNEFYRKLNDPFVQRHSLIEREALCTSQGINGTSLRITVDAELLSDILADESVKNGILWYGESGK
jgi:hypothetical protein